MRLHLVARQRTSCRLLHITHKNEKNCKNAINIMKGQSVHKIHLDMKEVLENYAPSQATAYKWTAVLQRSQQSTEDWSPV